MPYPPLDPGHTPTMRAPIRPLRCKECGVEVQWILAKVGNAWANQPCGHGAGWTLRNPKARP